MITIMDRLNVPCCRIFSDGRTGIIFSAELREVLKKEPIQQLTGERIRIAKPTTLLEFEAVLEHYGYYLRR